MPHTAGTDCHAATDSRGLESLSANGEAAYGTSPESGAQAQLEELGNIYGLYLQGRSQGGGVVLATPSLPLKVRSPAPNDDPS